MFYVIFFDYTPNLSIYYDDILTSEGYGLKNCRNLFIYKDIFINI